MADQQADHRSLLNRVRRLVHMRRSQPALQASAGFEVIYAEGGKLPFVYQREKAGERVIVAVNPSASAVEVRLEGSLLSRVAAVLYGSWDALTRDGDGWLLRLPGVSGMAYKVE